MFLVARLVDRLTTQGEKLQVMAEDSANIRNQLSWPSQVTPNEWVLSSISPDAFSNVLDRQIWVLSRQSTNNIDFQLVQACDEVLWMLEPKDATIVSTRIQHLLHEDASLKSKLRLIWLLSNEQPVAPWLPGVELERNPIKVHVLDDTLPLSRLENKVWIDWCGR